MNILIDDWQSWEARFQTFLTEQEEQADVAHDLGHILRVVANARKLAALSHADLHIVIPAAWLHDCVSVPKSSPLRKQASRMAAQAAGEFLSQAGYPSQFIPAIQHAIEAHSFSANIVPRSLEAQVVQDADRLDSLGAIGIARCLMLGAVLERPLYDLEEPLPHHRPADDQRYTIDHFYTKLLTLADTMQTPAGRAEAEKRTEVMRLYLQQLASEIQFSPDQSSSS